MCGGSAALCEIRLFLITSYEFTVESDSKIVETSGYAMVVHGRPKTPKMQVFWWSPSPQGSYSPYILGDTTRPGHVTCVLV